MKNLFRLTTAFAFVTLIGYIDFIIGDYATLYLLYLFPIIWIAYKNGIMMGLIIALYASTVWIIVDLIVEVNYFKNTFKIIDFTSRTIIISIISILVSSYKKANDELKKVAYIDQKTGAYNYRAFLEFSDKELAIANRERLHCYLAYFDMNKFKEVNDKYGHSAGDNVLKIFSDIANSSIRSSDFFCRIGGDEFIILFISKEETSADALLNRVKQQFELAMSEIGLSVTISIGLVPINDFSKNIEHYIHLADKEMYINKITNK